MHRRSPRPATAFSQGLPHPGAPSGLARNAAEYRSTQQHGACLQALQRSGLHGRREKREYSVGVGSGPWPWAELPM